MDIPLTPKMRRHADRQVRRGRYKNVAEVVNVALQRMETAERLTGSSPEDISLAGPGGSAGIGAPAFLVLTKATQYLDENLRTITAEVEAMTAAKDKLRDLISQVNRDVAANAGSDGAGQLLDFSRGLGSERAYHHVPVPPADPNAPGGVRLEPIDLYRGKIETYDELVTIRDGLKDQLDSLSEVSEMTSLRLQMTMDRRSKFMQTLSNIMKKVSSTDDILVQNLE
jgi:hypothetical protein